MTINLEVHWGYRVLTHIQMEVFMGSEKTPSGVMKNRSHWGIVHCTPWPPWHRRVKENASPQLTWRPCYLIVLEDYFPSQSFTWWLGWLDIFNPQLYLMGVLRWFLDVFGTTIRQNESPNLEKQSPNMLLFDFWRILDEATSTHHIRNISKYL